MADYFVAASGSNTAPYDTWAKAATLLQTALTAATAAGDRVIIQHDGVPAADAENAADVTYTVGGHILVVASTNSGTATITPTAMGTANWIGNSTLNRSVTIAGAFRSDWYGITIRVAGSTADSINIGAADAHVELEDCYLWLGNTAAASRINLGAGTSTQNAFVKASGTTLRFGSVSQGLATRAARIILNACTVASAGSLPTTFIDPTFGSGPVWLEGCDLSFITSTMVGNVTDGARDYVFITCLVGAGVTWLASQTPANRGSGSVWVHDCASGDEHYHFQFHDAFGSLTTDTGIYANDGVQWDGTNRASWKIVTSANCSYFTPFVSPWFDVYSPVVSAKTPSIEILRDGSTTAYNDDQVWGEWNWKGTANSTRSTFVSDRRALVGSAAAQAAGVGLSGWTGEAGSAWSGRLQPASAITPSEIGHIRGRVLVGAASSTVYADPQTRLA